MGKRFGSTIRIIAVLFLSVFTTNLAPAMTAYAATAPDGTGLETPIVTPADEETTSNEQPTEPAATFAALPDSQFTPMNFNQPRCIDLSDSSNLGFDWDGDNKIRVWSKDASKKLCDDVKLYLTSYTMPDTWNGNGFNSTALPQTKFDSDSVFLSKDSYGPSWFTSKKLQVNLPDACKNAQIDLYYAPEITQLTPAGHGDQYISHKFQYKARNCATTTVTPKAPTFNDVCGTRHDEYTIPAKTGVKYKVNGHHVSAGDHDGSGTTTITAYPASSDYVLSGDSEWTFHFTDKQCVKVKVIPQACVDSDAHNGKIQIKVTNNNDFGAWYKVIIGGNDHKTEYLSSGESHIYTFWGYTADTYHVKVNQISSYHTKTVYEDCVTIDECECDEHVDPSDPGDGNGGTPTTPGQVLGDSTNGGHILATSTTVPNVLPNTGAPATNPWLTIIAAAIAFLAVRAITRKKLITDQV